MRVICTDLRHKQRQVDWKVLEDAYGTYRWHQHSASQACEIGLTSIFGIGRTRARKICEATGIAYIQEDQDLTDSDLEKFATKSHSSPLKVTCVAKPP